MEWQGTAELSGYRFMSSVIPSSILWPVHDKRNILKFLETRIDTRLFFVVCFLFGLNSAPRTSGLYYRCDNIAPACDSKT